MPDRVAQATPDHAVKALADSTRDLLAMTGDRTMASFLSEWPIGISPSRRVTSRKLPVLEWIDSLEQAAVPATRALVKMFVDGARSLAWAQTYTPADFGASFLERYAWTELIGLRGPIASAKIAAGFLLLGPAVEYPLHSHEAEEVYFPLAGAAQWQRDDGDWIGKAPGTLIHHASGVPHAMRTEREPLLAFYVWRGGNLAQKSTIL